MSAAPTPLRAWVVGYNGQMGRALQELAGPLAWEVLPARALQESSTAPTAIEGDVLVDFSTPEGFALAVQLAERHRLPLVSGTTGLREQDLAALNRAAALVPALHATNMSVGMLVLRRLARQAAQWLEGFDVEIVEVHHRRKADAPSGSALTLGEEIERGRGLALEQRHGRSGRPGPRSTAELGYHALRGGDVVGEHTLHFLGPQERIELTHRAESRTLFARGALWAAERLRNLPAGRYDLGDLLER